MKEERDLICLAEWYLMRFGRIAKTCPLPNFPCCFVCSRKACPNRCPTVNPTECEVFGIERQELSILEPLVKKGYKSYSYFKKVILYKRNELRNVLNPSYR